MTVQNSVYIWSHEKIILNWTFHEKPYLGTHRITLPGHGTVVQLEKA